MTMNSGFKERNSKVGGISHNYLIDKDINLFVILEQLLETEVLERVIWVINSCTPKQKVHHFLGEKEILLTMMKFNQVQPPVY